MLNGSLFFCKNKKIVIITFSAPGARVYEKPATLNACGASAGRP